MTGMRDGDDLRRAGTDIRVFFLGLLLWLIGSIGVLAGRLIKAVISREREFLADASAVQFTRNPDGIGGALFKIGRCGSTIAQRHAEELSHMCIGAPVNDYFEFAWFHDHPPLDDRIERLLGPGAKRLLRERMERAEAAALAARGSPVVNELVSPLYAPRNAAPAAAALPGAAGIARAMVDSIGNPSSAHLDHARGMLDAIPAEIRTAVGSVEGAQAALFALLLGEGELRKAQLTLIGERSGAEVPAQSARFADALKPLGARARLPVLGLVIPTLKRLPLPERDALLEKVKTVIEADRKITLGGIRAAHAVQEPDPEGAKAPAVREVPQRRRGGHRGRRRAFAPRSLRPRRDDRVRKGDGRPRRTGRGAALAFRAEHRDGGERPQRTESARAAEETSVHQGLRRGGDGR